MQQNMVSNLFILMVIIPTTLLRLLMLHVYLSITRHKAIMLQKLSIMLLRNAHYS